MRAGLAGLAALAIAGCASQSAPRGEATLGLAPRALLAVGTGREVSFGRSPEGAIAAITQLAGTAPIATGLRPDCGSGSVTLVRYPTGLEVVFDNRMFAGWSLDGPDHAAPSGLRVGMSRPELDVLPDTTVSGERFSSGGISGRLGPDGRIAKLQAGLQCASDASA